MHILYRRDEDATRFRVIHIDRGSIYRGDGVVGQPARWLGGPPQDGASPDAVLQSLLTRAAEEGYHPAPQHTLMLQFPLGEADSDSHKLAVESLFANALVGCGYGTLDGSSPGDGKATAYASVVRPRDAAACCVDALREAGLLDGAILISVPPDEDGGRVVHWPEGYDAGSFSIL